MPVDPTKSILNLAVSTAAARNEAGGVCAVKGILAALDAVDRAALEALLALPAAVCRHSAIHAGLHDPAVVEKYPHLPDIKADTVGRHRNGSCRCGDTATRMLLT